jgi:hypothetical protein
MVTVIGNSICPSCNGSVTHEYDTARPNELLISCLECGYYSEEIYKLDHDKYDFIQKNASELMKAGMFAALAYLLNMEDYFDGTLEYRIEQTLLSSHSLYVSCLITDKNGDLLPVEFEEYGGTGIYYYQNKKEGANYSVSLPEDEDEKNTLLSSLKKERETNPDVSISILVYDQEQQTAIAV